MKLATDENAHFEVINGRRVVKKHVATIHCSNRLSLLERKISNALLFNAYPNLNKTLIHEISLDQLKRLLNANTRNHKALKEALKKLISTVIEWNVLGDDVPELDIEGWNASTILSSVSVKNGIVRYQYSELIKSLIIDPKIYGKINLIIQSRFKSAYALALYENCARYRGLKYTKNFEYSIFRKLMGVEEGKYEQFRDFNRRVLSPAITEINACSDIFITADISRRGRKVHSIKFKLEERAIKKRLGQQLKSASVTNIDTNYVIKVSEEFGIDILTIKYLISQFGSDKVEQAIEYVKSRPKYLNGEITNLAGYLRSAIENNYRANIADKQKGAISSEERIEKHQIRDFENIIKYEYRKYLSKEMKKIFESLDIEKQKNLEMDFSNKDSKYFSPQAAVYYNQLGINNILVFEAGFTDYLVDRHPALAKDILEFDVYRSQYQNKEKA